MPRNQESQGPKDVFLPFPPSQQLKLLISMMMTEHADEIREVGPIEMVTWVASRTHLYGVARRWIHHCLLDVYEQEGRLAIFCRSKYATHHAGVSICSEVSIR